MLDKIRAIELFNRIAELKSFARAADCLELSHPAASRLIAELEKTVGVQLLHRTTRSVTLTSAGAEFFEKSQKLEQAADVLFSGSPLPDAEPEGKIRVGCSGSFARFYLLKAIKRFMAQHKKVQFELIIVDGEIKLAEQRLDIAFQTGGQLNPNYIAHRVGHCESVLCASKNYLENNDPIQIPEDLNNHQLIANLHFSRNWQLTKGKERWDIAIKGSFSCNNASMIMDAVMDDMGIGLLPDIALSQFPNDKQLVRLLVDWHFPQMDIVALVDHRYLATPVRLFIKHIRQEMSCSEKS